MVITLLCTVLLAALVFYVMNLGRQANQRILTQHAADAAAHAGSAWVARTFNTVALNNVTMARLIAMANVLDSMPLAVQFTHTDQQSLAEAVADQLSRGITHDWVRAALQQVAAEVATELQTLGPMDQLFNDPGSSLHYDVTQATFYDSPAGRGQIWQAMAVLDAYSQAAVQNMGVLAQLNAVRGGELNMIADDPEAGAMMLPILPQAPVQRGHFDHFRDPVTYGLLRAEIDDPVQARGPYDALYGQRDLVRAGGHHDGPRYHGNVPIGQASGGGTWTPGEPEAYRVYGPLGAMLRHFGGINQSHLRHSRLSRHLSQQAQIKLGYLWPGTATATVNQPQWINSWTQATQIAESEPGRIVNTRFVAVEIKSAFPRHHPQFLSPGTWIHVDRSNAMNNSPRTIHTQGWMDPRSWNVTKTDDYIWLDDWTYQISQDVSIGLDIVTDADGNIVPHTVYRYDHFVFAGVNVGTAVAVRNPHNFMDRDSLPAPMDLLTGALPDDGLGNPQPIPFLAVAHRDDRALLWPSRFTADKPALGMVAISGAQVFNDHSLDLWTQMWHAQVAEVTQTQYQQWVQQFEATEADAALTTVLDAEEVNALLKYLKSIEPLAFMLNH